MKNIGKILEIFSAKEGTSGLPRPKVEELNLIKNYGIEFDKFAGKNLDQSLMMVGLKSYELSKSFGIPLVFGSLGENILTDFDPHNFEVGTIFQINKAKVQITQICTVCNHLSVFDKDLPKLLKNHRGVYCKILESGKLTKNMIIKEI